MHAYNLIIKRGDLDNDAASAMVNRQLTDRFGPAVHYLTHALLDNEVVVIVRHESKRRLQSTLGDWFNEQQRTLEGEGDEAAGRPSGYPEGTLLHYREILPDEPIMQQLGG
jgi:hypothetical protein